MTPIKYEHGTYRQNGMEYTLIEKKSASPQVQIMHRSVTSRFWDIAYGDAMHTQEVWNAIKRDGVKV